MYVIYANANLAYHFWVPYAASTKALSGSEDDSKICTLFRSFLEASLKSGLIVDLHEFKKVE